VCWRCRLTGRDLFQLHVRSTRLALRCACGRTTPGWPIRPRFWTTWVSTEGPPMTERGVRGFLVTGPDEHIARFHLAVAVILNGLERRGHTVFYTCFAEHVEFALQTAERADVTVQEVEIVDDEETYPVRRLGSHGLTWVKPSLRTPAKAEGRS
jgi:hypothetical protein